MEQNILELHAFLEEEGKRKPLYIQILAPTKTRGQEDYSCLVHAPLLLSQDKKIYGVDPDQARSLAVGFIRSLLENKTILDADGKPVNF